MPYIHRSLSVLTDHHAFLFGARNTGKSTLLQHTFKRATCFWIDLLDLSQEEQYARDPMRLQREVSALAPHITHVIIYEIQKLPKLLDVVHLLMGSTSKIFILTGSSARKLRHGGSNLLAGRAFVYHLYPFSSFELGKHFNLQDALAFGTLPSVSYLTTTVEKQHFLQTYAQIYLREEVWQEQIIRKLDPFRRFLEVSAQANGKIINFSNISKDVGVDEKTIQNYFSILEDTLIGFMLESFQHSFRKRLSAKPKFYYFDPGVARALSRQLTVDLQPETKSYGDAFEHFIILECIRLANYNYPEYRFSYLRTKDDVEVDLVVERPGEKILFIEIKSATSIYPEKISNFMTLISDFGDCEAVCLSQVPRAQKIEGITVFPWQEGLKKFFIKKHNDTQ
jgi:predicted AAA+ superfamily ATPase